jgi:hypothetical protein
MRKFNRALLTVLFLSAAYLIAWPSATVPYFGAVVLHFAAGGTAFRGALMKITYETASFMAGARPAASSMLARLDLQVDIIQKHYCLRALDVENAASTHWLQIPISRWRAPLESTSVEKEFCKNLAIQIRSNPAP